MEIEVLKDITDIRKVVEIHLEAFTGFFLTFLGKGFLYHLYKGFLTHDKSNLLAAKNDNGDIMGFLAYSEDLSGFYKYLIKNNLLPFAYYAFIAFLKKPSSVIKLLSAFLKPSESAREERYIEISSIGVLPQYSNMGVGSALIAKVKSNTDFDTFSYIKLETDAADNEKANKFYQKNGFDLSTTYKTHQGRIMNEYHFRGNI